MSHSMPQEIEVWYLLPALRRALAHCFVEQHGKTQKKASELLGLTQSAVSQYLSEKRATTVEFTPQEHERIEQAASAMVERPEEVKRLLYELSMGFKGSPTLCAVHRRHDASVPHDCDICGFTTISSGPSQRRDR